MRISDWSSDVCSSDLAAVNVHVRQQLVSGVEGPDADVPVRTGRGIAGARAEISGRKVGAAEIIGEADIPEIAALAFAAGRALGGGGVAELGADLEIGIADRGADLPGIGIVAQQALAAERRLA